DLERPRSTPVVAASLFPETLNPQGGAGREAPALRHRTASLRRRDAAPSRGSASRPQRWARVARPVDAEARNGRPDQLAGLPQADGHAVGLDDRARDARGELAWSFARRGALAGRGDRDGWLVLRGGTGERRRASDPAASADAA